MTSNATQKGIFHGTTSKFGPTSTTHDIVTQLNVKLDGKVVLITGATSGNFNT